MRCRSKGRSFLLGSVTMLIVLIAGATVLWIRTDGGRAFTTEGARRLAVARTPRALPSIRLEASDGARFALDALRGRTVIVDFIYTNCPTLCVTLGSSFAQLQAALDTARREDVRLLSIGFDHEHDTPAALTAYAHHHGADPRRWMLARVADRRELQPLLSSFGVVAIADGYGGFTHNAALHVIDPRGRLVRILDADDVAGVMSLLAARTVQ